MTMTIGSMMPMAPAAEIDQSLTSSPPKDAMATGSVLVRMPGQHEREQELVVGEQQAEQRRDGQARAGQRQDHDAEGLPEIAAIDRGGFVEVARDVEEEAVHQPDREGLVDRHQRQDQQRIGVDHAEKAAHDEERDCEQHVGEHAHREQPEQDRRGAPLRHARQAVGGQAADRNRDQNRAGRDDQAVDEIAEEVALEPDLVVDIRTSAGR